MLGLLLAAALAASPPPRLALTDLSPVQLSAAEAGLFTEQLAQDLAGRGLSVLSNRDVAALLGFERQKQLLGCSDDSCTAELAGALGVDALVKGDIGKLGEGYALTLKVLNARDAAVLARWNGTAANITQVRGLLARGAWELARQLSVSLARPELSPTGAAPPLEGAPVAGDSGARRPVSRLWAILPGAVAVAGLAAGGAFQAMAVANLAAMKSATYREDAVQARDDGIRNQNIARVGFLVAAVGALATTAVLVFAGGDAQPAATPSVSVSPSGASMGLTWRLP